MSQDEQPVTTESRPPGRGAVLAGHDEARLRRHRRPRRVPVHPGELPVRLPAQALDVPAVLRLRHRRRDQRPLQVPARARRHRPVGGRRPADPDRLRLRRPRRRPRRSAGSAWRSTRWPTPRSSSTASPSTGSRRRGPSTGRRPSCWPSTSLSEEATGPRREAPGHDPERHPEGVRRPRHVDLAARAVDPPDRRHDRVLRRRRPPLQRHLGGRRPLPRRRLHRRRRRWPSRCPTP